MRLAVPCVLLALLLAGCSQVLHPELRGADLHGEDELRPTRGLVDTIAWSFDVPAAASFVLWTSQVRFEGPWWENLTASGARQTSSENGLGDGARERGATEIWSAMSRPRSGAWSISYSAAVDGEVEAWLFVCASDDARRACREHAPQDAR